MASPKNRFLDDDKIVVKNDNSQPEAVEPKKEDKEIVKETPKQEIPSQEIQIAIENKEESTQIQQSINEIEINSSLDEQSYLNIINGLKQTIPYKGQLPNRSDDLDKILKDTYKKPDMPLYNVSKNYQTGEVSVKPKNAKPVPIEQRLVESEPTIEEHPKQKEIIKNLIEKADMDILTRTIEVNVLLELINDETDLNKKKLYDVKMQTLKEDLEFLRKRKTVLEKMF